MTYIFRHEIEEKHAMPIKSKRRLGKESSWPEIRITDAPACPADIWIQLVENKTSVDGHHNPVPSPNGLFHKKGREWTAPHGIIIQDGSNNPNGKNDGMKNTENNVNDICYNNLINLAARIIIISFDYNF